MYGEGEVRGSNISYTQKSLQAGKWMLAGTIFHELMHNCGATDEETCEKALYFCGRLPQVPVGQRDTGGIEPVRPGVGFFKAEVRRLSGRANLMFIEMVGRGHPAGCSGGNVFIDPNNAFWSTAYTAQVERLAREIVELCWTR